MGSEYASDYKVKEIITEIIEWFVVIDAIQIKKRQLVHPKTLIRWRKRKTIILRHAQETKTTKKNDTQNKKMILKLCIIDLNFIDTHWRKQMWQIIQQIKKSKIK